MPAAAIVGSAVIGGIASNRAARAQERATNNATASQERMAAQAREDLQPFRDAGAGVLGPLQEAAMNDPFNLPFERQQGFREIQNSAAAGGRMNSGGTLKALADYNAGITARFDQQQYNKLFNLASMGSNAAGQQATNSIQAGNSIADLMTQGGNARAAGYMGMANAANDGIGNYLYLNRTNQLGTSDRRLKTAIRKVGEYMGINLYQWQWNDKAKALGVDHEPTIGVMAQEVPEYAVEINGYLRVDYGRLFNAA